MTVQTVQVELQNLCIKILFHGENILMNTRCLIITILIALFAHTASAAEISNMPKKSGLIIAIEKVKALFTASEKSYGIESGTVLTEDYDIGFGVGARLNQTFMHPYIDRPFLRSSPGIRFWGISNEDQDISVVGISETITHMAPLHPRLTLSAGLTGGINYIYKKTAVPGSVELEEDNTNSFDFFITLGAETPLTERNVLFFEFKYGETFLERQIHALIGINFAK